MWTQTHLILAQCFCGAGASIRRPEMITVLKQCSSLRLLLDSSEPHFRWVIILHILFIRIQVLLRWRYDDQLRRCFMKCHFIGGRRKLIYKLTMGFGALLIEGLMEGNTLLNDQYLIDNEEMGD